MAKQGIILSLVGLNPQFNYGKALETTKKQIIYYRTISGKCPFLEWYVRLDEVTQDILDARIDRLTDGLRGDWKKLSNSKLSELRINYSRGYRIYYRELNNVIVLIVAGGDKSNQKRLIKQADKFLKDYEERN
ncbi:MAG: hypothetical protein J6Y94_03975 [Bacteriovoracaceae bacterium]|nr:hypothetical protein [Bacteriovoracaceae bacterium]